MLVKMVANFLFCVPDVDDVEVAPVERTGRRTIGMTVKPRTTTAEAQTNEVRVREDDSEASVAAPVEAGSVAGDDGVAGASDGNGTATSSDASGSATTVSSATAAAEAEEFRAGVELTK